MSELATSLRTHTCGELRAAHVPAPGKDDRIVPADDTEVLLPRTVSRPPAIVLCGHVDTLLPGPAFLLRDSYGKTLVRVDPQALPYVADRFGKLGLEDVVQVGGEAGLRSEKDPANPTGEVLLKARKIEILSRALPVPEAVLKDAQVPVKDRLALRQLYLRRPEMQARMALRSQVSREAREFFLANDFLELETPQLFLYDPVALGSDMVPVSEKRAFGLAGGPLVFDQYIRAGQFDRFFQFVPVTTNETAPTPMHAQEFTGLDVNMAYVDVPDFLACIEGLIAHLWQAVLGEEPPKVARLTYDEAMLRYGNEQPDLRYEMQISDLGAAAGAGQTARAFRAPAAKLSDEEVRALAGDLAFARVGAGGKLEGAAKELVAGAAKAMGAAMGDVIVVATAGKAHQAAKLAGEARIRFAKKLGLIDEKKHAFTWIYNIPVFDEDGRPKSIVFARLARDEDKDIFNNRNADRKKTQSKAFDLVMDGLEIASGFVGFHHLAEQRQFWERIHQLDLSDMSRMRAPIEGHRFGCPPYAAMNLGFDRLMARLCNVAALDEVVPLPKSATNQLPVLQAPAPPDDAALKELLMPDNSPAEEEERVEA